MKFPTHSLNRFNCQHKIIQQYIEDLPAQAIHENLTDTKWSIQEVIAYLVRYHHLFLNRVKAIRREINPFFEVYAPENDPEFKFCVARSTGSLLHEIERLRGDIRLELDRMDCSEYSRIATHAVMGRMNLVQWIEFFLLHESAQLYKIFRIAGSFWTSNSLQHNNIISMPIAYNMDEMAG